ncbi:S16 family serine protease [Streptacidiphilus rugosus]|uniref:S16 family serine protease n=1 Tax=Streptacidiphilus rugosus TaxID=405783 RepID=UPI000567F9BC|nr:S16 family serine protease [Streptacidiphilus rugosus]
MFFKHKHLLNELRRDGRSATAEILSIKTVGSGSSIRAVWASDTDLSSGWTDCSMKLRVVPEDRAELPFEASVLTRVHTMKLQGGHVPVWYDPADHSRVVVDYEADLREKVHLSADLDRLAHRYDQRLGMVWTPVADTLLPVAVMLTPGRGRVTATGALGVVLQHDAETAVAAVRALAGLLLPQLPADWFARHDLRIDEPYGDVPPGATAEDVAGAALAVAVAVVSLLSGRIARAEVAVTGGIAATGEVLPVTATKSRARATRKGYSTVLVLPAGNEADAARKEQGLEFSLVATLPEAVRATLGKHALKGFVPPA